MGWKFFDRWRVKAVQGFTTKYQIDYIQNVLSNKRTEYATGKADLNTLRLLPAIKNLRGKRSNRKCVLTEYVSDDIILHYWVREGFENNIDWITCDIHREVINPCFSRYGIPSNPEQTKRDISIARRRIIAKVLRRIRDKEARLRLEQEEQRVLGEKADELLQVMCEARGILSDTPLIIKNANQSVRKVRDELIKNNISINNIIN